MKCIGFRYVPTKNGQQKNVKYAKDYRLTKERLYTIMDR